ncbi:MAG: head GIN domain-containing protein [Cyclobacteriaceae bacterium]
MPIFTHQRIYLLILFSGLTLFNAAYAQGVRGNGNVLTETRFIAPFSAIVITGSVDVYLSQDEEESITIEADENLLDVIATEIEGNTLRIYEKKNIRKAESRKVYVNFQEINSLIAKGATDVYSRSPLQAETLELGISGASDVTLEVYVDELICRVKGAADAYLSGEAGVMIAKVSGSCDLEAGRLVTQVCQIEASGASDAQVHAIESLDAKASDSSDIEYRGNPEILRKEESTAADITSRN